MQQTNKGEGRAFMSVRVQVMPNTVACVMFVTQEKADMSV